MKNAAYSVITLIGIMFLLIEGQSLLIPFILALLFWFIGHSLKKTLDKVGFIRRKFPSWLKNILSATITIGVISFGFNLILDNIADLRASYPLYEANLTSVIESINERFDISLLEIAKRQFGNLNFGEILGDVFSSITDLLGNTFLIVIYLLFIVLEEANFTAKLEKIFPKKEDYKSYMTILQEIGVSISDYLRLKAFVSLITGVLSFIALYFIGVEAPAFWAFLIFILNFIPTIGSLIGTVFPAVFSLLQFGEVIPFFTVLAIVGLIQVLVGNVIEPRLMGSSMNISPLVTILALSLWGFIWGIIGMILSVPITVIMIIVFSRFEKTKSIAILLSEKGEI